MTVHTRHTESLKPPCATSASIERRKKRKRGTPTHRDEQIRRRGASHTPPLTHAGRADDQLPVGRAFLTVLKVALALLPSAVSVPMQTTMIRANMTAYSTAVGPSSALRNLTTFFAN